MNIDLQAWWKMVELNVLDWWGSLTPDDWYNAWLVSGAVWFLCLAWFSNRIMRKALGHVLFRGTWYDADQFETLVKMIDEDNTKGFRVMKHDEMSLLRRWKLGDTKTYGVRQSGYF